MDRAQWRYRASFAFLFNLQLSEEDKIRARAVVSYGTREDARALYRELSDKCGERKL